MKPLMTWMKANLAIVVLSAVILLSLPAAFVGSQMWNKKIRKSRETVASKAMADLEALKITYHMPGATPNDPGKPLPLPAPNEVATAYFKQHREQLEKQINEVAAVATQINSQGHKPMLDGLFPTPTGNLKTLEMAEMIVGRPDRPSVYADLLKSVNAGGPADPVRVAEVIKEIEIQFREKVRSDTSRSNLLPEEEADLTKRLVAARIGQYQQHAGGISVYATMESLPAGIPRVAPPEPPEADECFEWQYDYWVTADLLRAVDSANGGPSSRLPVDKAPVKRVERIALDPPIGASEASITGRKNSPENKLYDVRCADLTLVVASAKLLDVVNAFSRTNFMTVIGVDLAEVDPWSELEKGFYYGDDHVVRASLRVETIWLRSWTEPLMPEPYKLALAGTAPEGDLSGAGAAPAPITSGGKGGGAAAPRGGDLGDEPAPRAKSGRSRPGGAKGRNNDGGG